MIQETVSAEVVPFMAGSEVQVSCKDVRGLDEHTTIVINDVLFLEIRSTEGKIIKPWGKIGCSLNDGTRKCISIKKSIEFKPSTQPVLRDWLEDQMVVVSDRVDVVLVQDGVPRDLVHYLKETIVKALGSALGSLLHNNNNLQQVSSWLKSMWGWYKVNTDGGRRGQDGFAICGRRSRMLLAGQFVVFLKLLEFVP
ncbi:hypothetical protein V6N11_022140 [Hibiscus sabdariffa]|uniref:Uncharacterized protein n=1 Tax=Hibiscus sabdariffa TaxID=183260 RepID=A0ABR2TIP2_9ROSI